LNDIVKSRFHHGSQNYSIGNNFLAMAAGKISGRSYDNIIKADDILKSSEADCRQQCLVMMELLSRKGYPVRAVFLKAKKYGEHYTFETFYNKSWHFFDPDVEPDGNLLTGHNRPGIAELAKDTALLTAAYGRFSRELVIALFGSYKYGRENELIPARLYIFHDITKILSVFLWIALLMIYLYSRLLLKAWRFSPLIFWQPQSLKWWKPAFAPLLYALFA
jgi:hypothetical protein